MRSPCPLPQPTAPCSTPGFDEVGAGRVAVVDLRPHRDDGARGIARRLALTVEAAIEVADDAEGVAGPRALVDPVLQHRHLALEQAAVVAFAVSGSRLQEAFRCTASRRISRGVPGSSVTSAPQRTVSSGRPSAL